MGGVVIAENFGRFYVDARNPPSEAGVYEVEGVAIRGMQPTKKTDALRLHRWLIVRVNDDITTVNCRAKTCGIEIHGYISLCPVEKPYVNTMSSRRLIINPEDFLFELK